jgi:hypothetical protein
MRRGHICGIEATTRNAICWGANEYEQATPPAPAVGEYSDISAGQFHACAIEVATRAVRCWGLNNYGQAGPPAGVNGGYAAISAGSYHTCGIEAATRAARCWGAGSPGDVPNCRIDKDTLVTSPFICGQSTPPTVAGGYLAIAAGGTHTCGIVAADRTVMCWGNNGNLAEPHGSSEVWGQATPPGGQYLAITAGQDHSCGIEADTRAVTCWGRNDHNQSTPPVPPHGGYSRCREFPDFVPVSSYTSGVLQVAWDEPVSPANWTTNYTSYQIYTSSLSPSHLVTCAPDNTGATYLVGGTRASKYIGANCPGFCKDDTYKYDCKTT